MVELNCALIYFCYNLLPEKIAQIEAYKILMDTEDPRYNDAVCYQKYAVKSNLLL